MKNYNDKENRKTLMAYIALCAFGGSTYLAIRIGVSELPPMIFAGIRFLIAGSLMIGYAILKRLDMPKNLFEVSKISILGIFLLVGGSGLVIWAETRVASGIASLMAATVPLFMAIIDFLSPSKTKLNWKGWLGLFIGFAGVLFLVFSDWNESSVDMLGMGILIISAISWAFGSVYSKNFTITASTISNSAIQMLSGGICLTIAGIALGEFTRVHITAKGMGALLYLVVFGSIIGYSCYVYVLQNWPISKASTYAYVNPIVAVLLGAIFIGEVITIKIIIATVTILTGIILVQTSKYKFAPKPEKNSSLVENSYL